MRHGHEHNNVAHSRRNSFYYRVIAMYGEHALDEWYYEMDQCHWNLIYIP